MGKQGPCYHCGVTSTPLWRNGPPDKPVLCNACGSRWRTKGSLTNYTPLHARGPLDQLEEFKTSKPKTMYLKHKEPKLHKVKQHIGNTNGEYEMLDCDQNYQRGFDEDTSNRSSSGSAISFSESSAHFSGADVSDVTGSSQSNAWELIVPSKRRTGVTRPKASSVEKLTKDLHSILHQQASYLSGLSEEELLYESGTPTGSVEIGNGGVLIRNLATLDEELEASSPSIENKSSYSGLPLPVNMPNKGPGFTNIASEKVRRVHAGQENLKRDRMVQENSIILPNKDSHIYCHGLPDIVSFDGFMRYLTCEEQQHLLKYLPCTDTTDPPESLKSMFSSQQFQETFSYYQMLKQEGVFDRSFAEDVDEHRILKELVMCSLSKTWVEHHQTLKDAHKKGSSDKKGINGTNFVYSSNLLSLKRPRDLSNNGFAEPKFAMKTPRKVCRTYKSLGSARSSEPDCRDVGIKSIQASNDYTENDGSCCSPRTLFACPSDRSSMLGSLQFSEDQTDHDLLLDVRSNSSFPEAELLSDLFKLKAVPKSMSAESEVLDKDGNSCSSIKQQSRICHMLE